jgi:23S rRNA (pseudouridine1915-N3)-methyltransferase
MKIVLATISPRRNASGPASELLKVFVERIVFYVPCEHRAFASEAQLIAFLETSAGRTRPYLIVTDSRGKQLSSEETAVRLSSVIDGGTQLLVLAIGPADGWSAPR